MFKKLDKKVWVFDSEWVPDPRSGRLLYRLSDTLSDEEVFKKMWMKGGANEENPTPFLKTVLCRLVSISAVTRTEKNGEVVLHLLSLPKDPSNEVESSETNIIHTFLTAIGTHKPQLVGYNSNNSDIKILIQRGIANAVQAKDFCKRPDKPWEGIDYFARGSDNNIDLMDIVGSWGKGAPSLNEMATVCGIPGKIAVDGNQVAELWLEGKLNEIVAYNEFDALTTYLLWLRTAYFGGFFSQDQYDNEQQAVINLINEESIKPSRIHLQEYLKEWERLKEVYKVN